MSRVEPVSRAAAETIHDGLVARFGGLSGVRDGGALEAALAQPWQSFGGVELYPTLEEKAARLCFEVVTQHPFNDGNKRCGAALMGALLRANGARFKPRAADYLAAVLSVADGSAGYGDLLAFVRRCTGE